jgi:hypothetical protein
MDALSHVLVAYVTDRPVACGALREYDATTVEIKRMYVSPESPNSICFRKDLA